MDFLSEIELCIELIRLSQRIGIDQNQGIQARTLIVCTNALQVLLDHLVTADAMFTNGVLRFGDRDFSDVEPRRGMRRNREHGGAGQKNG
jgi:hypothetical protein